MSKFKNYKRKGLSEMRPYELGEELAGISVSDPDMEAGSPKVGDMVARNPKNHQDQWLVAKKYFDDNLEIVEVDIFDGAVCVMEENLYGIEVKRDKQLRVNLDNNLQRLKSLIGSRERSLSITKLQEAIMWLGMDLKRLSESNPYPDSYDPKNDKIAPTADGLKL